MTSDLTIDIDREHYDSGVTDTQTFFSSVVKFGKYAAFLTKRSTFLGFTAVIYFTLHHIQDPHSFPPGRKRRRNKKTPSPFFLFFIHIID